MPTIPQIAYAPDEAATMSSYTEQELFLILCNVARSAIGADSNGFLGRALRDDDWDKIIQDDKPEGLGLKRGSDSERVWRMSMAHILNSLCNNAQYGVHFTHIHFRNGSEKYIDSTFAWTLDGVAVDLGRKAWLSKPPASNSEIMA